MKGNKRHRVMKDGVSVYLELGRHFLEEGDYELAINALTKAIELAPQNAQAYDLRGVAHGYRFEFERTPLSVLRAPKDWAERIAREHAAAYNKTYPWRDRRS